MNGDFLLCRRFEAHLYSKQIPRLPLGMYLARFFCIGLLLSWVNYMGLNPDWGLAPSFSLHLAFGLKKLY